MSRRRCSTDTCSVFVASSERPLRRLTLVVFVLAFASLTLLEEALAAIRVPFAFVSGHSATRQGGIRSTSIVGRQAGVVADQNAYVNIVNVVCLKEKSQEFYQATLERARPTMKEPNCLRFDIQQQVDEYGDGVRGKFKIIEAFKTADGATKNKETEHYKKWADTVAAWMYEPRSTTNWDVIMPFSTDQLKTDAIIIERPKPMYFDIEHVNFAVSRDCVQAFTRMTIDYVEDSVKEGSCLRFDFLKKPGPPPSDTAPYEFLIRKVYRGDDSFGSGTQSFKKHFTERHFLRWREIVSAMLAKPRTDEQYVNLYPHNAAGWGKYGLDPLGFR